MAVYKPTYRDPKTGDSRESKVWWYEFVFAGKRIRESSKSTRKTIATEAERKRRLELEQGFNSVEDTRKERLRTVAEIAAVYLEDYEVRHPDSFAFAKWATGHVTRLAGKTIAFDVTEETIAIYQRARIKEGASPKSINMEVTVFLRLVGDLGDVLRARLKRKKTLRLREQTQVAKAYTPEEKASLLEECRRRRSKAIYPALMLAQNAGLRKSEMLRLRWSQVDLDEALVTVGKSKTAAGEGRTIPLNVETRAALGDYAAWYAEKFGETNPEWYVFPFGKPQPTDPTRPAGSLKTVWKLVQEKAGVTGRWHDNRHTFVTDLAESGDASDETIRDIAGHVSPQMLKHYSHIRMEAKRRAVAALSSKTKKSNGEGVDRGISEGEA